jgi:stringent starvation protein B
MFPADEDGGDPPSDTPPPSSTPEPTSDGDKPKRGGSHLRVVK